MTALAIDKNAPVTAKLLLRGDIEALTPLLMGQGEGEDIDAEIIRGYEGHQPYVPATGFIGALRSHIKPNMDDAIQRSFWGGRQNSDVQSHLIVDDLLPHGIVITSVRDGIRLNYATGLVEDKAKYDFEIVEQGTHFTLQMEITVRQGIDVAAYQAILSVIVTELAAGAVRIGAMTTRGMGKIKLQEGYTVSRFDFPQHGPDWLAYCSTNNPPPDRAVLLPEVDPLHCNRFVVSADFHLRGPILVGAYPTDPALPDKVQIRSGKGKEPVLTGTSLRGALRSRAERIVVTLGGNPASLYDLFGYVATEGGKNKPAVAPKKSRLVVDEVPVTGGVAATQSRIRIDRFTGGVAETALFDSMPLWQDAAHKAGVSLRMQIRDFDLTRDGWMAGLLLMLLKDLWTGDLAIGGEKAIGRGRLNGVSATIAWQEHEYTLTQAEGDKLLILPNPQPLEQFAEQLVKHCAAHGGTSHA